MFTSLITGTIMLNVATWFALPVSTTHTIVGCIMGFSIVAKGFDSIDWETGKKIFVSWLVSPLSSAVVAFFFFGCVKYGILRSEHPFQRAYYTFPIVVTIFIGIDLFYILYKGFNNKDWQEDLVLSHVLGYSFAAGAGCGLVWIVGIGPIAAKRAKQHVADKNEAEAKAAKDLVASDEEESPEKPKGEDEVVVVEASEKAATPEQAEEAEPAKKSFLQSMADSTYNQDLHSQSMHESHRAAEIWDANEQFDAEAEQLFTYAQVFTACLNSFAHGANDVANAIAPVSAMLSIFKTGVIESKSQVDKWILAYGGVGIVVGLLVFGYRVMKSIGFKLTGLSPSRGACAELAASLFVVTASYMEIPVSSTQSIVGAVAGVGLVGGPKNVQWLFLLRVCVGWAAVFFTAVVIEAGIFCMFAYTPTLITPSE
jgi:sodium-dependent phosphate transporter